MKAVRPKGNPGVLEHIGPELGGKLVELVRDDMLRAQREREERARRKDERKRPSKPR